MLTDSELAQMKADAERIEALRQNATEGPWLRDLDRPRTIMSASNGLIGGVLYNTNGGSDADFIAATRTDPSAANVLRLMEEVERLRFHLRRHVSHPSSWGGFHSQQQLDDVLTVQDRERDAISIIDACHIHGVPVPEHLKPYEKGGDA